MISKFDFVAGRTTDASRSGTFVRLAGGDLGWIGGIYLPKDTCVMCSVSGVKEDGFVYLALDSVVYSEAA